MLRSKELLLLLFTMLILGACTTSSFTPYFGEQQEWPISKGAFATEFNGIVFFESSPSKPYIVLGYVDAPVYLGLNCPPEGEENCWKRVIARNAVEHNANAVIVAKEWVSSEGNVAQVFPGLYGPVVTSRSVQNRTRRAILIQYK